MSSVPKKLKEIDTTLDDPGQHPSRVVNLTSNPVWNTVLFFSIAFVGCAVDLLTKHWVFQWRGGPNTRSVWWLWEGYIGIETTVNTGALFGLGQDRVALFAGISLVAILAILYWLFVSGGVSDRFMAIALGCVFGGILGNLYDRLGLWGFAGVRDFILLRYENHTWPNFNVADSPAGGRSRNADRAWVSSHTTRSERAWDKELSVVPASVD